MTQDRSSRRGVASGSTANDGNRRNHIIPTPIRARTTPSIYDSSPVRRAVALAGGQTALARRLGLRPQSVQQWVANNRIPLNRTRDVAEALGHAMTIEELRPDYFKGASGDGVE